MNKTGENEIIGNILHKNYIEYERVFTECRLGSSLEIKIIDMILEDYSNHQLLYLFHKLNLILFNKISVNFKLLEKWLDEEFLGSTFNIYFNMEGPFDEECIKYSDLRRSIVRYLAKVLEKKSNFFLLFSGFLFQTDVDLFKRKNNDVQLHEWANLEYQDFILWNDYESETNGKSNFYNFIRIADYSLKAADVIREYLNEEGDRKKNEYFWLLKWKFLTGKDFSIYDKRLENDNRFLAYYSKVLKIELIKRTRMEEVFDWPILRKLDNYNKVDDKIFDSFMEESPLKMLGYSVGVSSDMNKVEREEVLAKAFYANGLVFISYGWSTSGSPNRLHSISKHLAQNIWRFRWNNSYEQAVKDWKNDLDFLKKTFFDNKMADEFIWPNV